jgi:hypothetical protein
MEYRWVIERRWQLREDCIHFGDLSGRVWKTGGMMLLTGENGSTLEDELLHGVTSTTTDLTWADLEFFAGLRG